MRELQVSQRRRPLSTGAVLQVLVVPQPVGLCHRSTDPFPVAMLNEDEYLRTQTLLDKPDPRPST